jgi:H+/gluconate symporter-like permease
VFITLVGLAYLEWRRRSLMARGEGYGTDLRNEPGHVDTSSLPSPWLAIAPLLLIGISNFAFTRWIPA